eukprot:TRINITY_DN28194_c0_g1_i1.p1 TRINITY_DN28194_c0_g1~~TRINITY_DN28194_c0_g1_i1.p1  ORF type:complete len:179 (+),score=39.67 TRINITY_DN28194_c0_g1_i1:41-577(+)
MALTPSRGGIPSGNTSRLVRRIHEGMTVAERRALAEELIAFRREEVDDAGRRAGGFGDAGAAPEGYIEQVAQLSQQLCREARQLEHPELLDLKVQWDELCERLGEPRDLVVRGSEAPKRIDPTDNRAYTEAQYMDHYGREEGARRWGRAEPVTRCPLCRKNFRTSKIKLHAGMCAMAP